MTLEVPKWKRSAVSGERVRESRVRVPGAERGAIVAPRNGGLMMELEKSPGESATLLREVLLEKMTGRWMVVLPVRMVVLGGGVGGDGWADGEGAVAGEMGPSIWKRPLLRLMGPVEEMGPEMVAEPTMVRARGWRLHRWRRSGRGDCPNWRWRRVW